MRSPPVIEVFCDPEMNGLQKLRETISLALKRAGLPANWIEHYEGFGSVPSHLRKVVPPVMFINERLVWDGHFSRELPRVETITLAIIRSRRHAARRNAIILIKSHLSFFAAIIIALFPKCPFCWLTYTSMFSFLGFQSVPYQPWLLPILICLLVINILSLYLTRKRHKSKPLILSLTGTLLIVSNRLLLEIEALTVVGMFFLITASLWNSLGQRILNSIIFYFKRNLTRHTND